VSDVAYAARAFRGWTAQRIVVPQIGLLRGSVCVVVAVVVALQAWAISVDYGLRVTSDMPTYLALLGDLAVSPGQPASPFLTTPGVETSHATPWLQALAWVWDAVAPAHDAAGAPSPDPVAAARLLGVGGIAVGLLLLHAVFVWVRAQAGSRAAWLSVPALLTLFGPAHVIWAGDLTFHGLLYAGFYPQTLGIALLLYTLRAADLPRRRERAALITAGVAATMVVHPFTGLILAALLAAEGVRRSFTATSGALDGVPIAVGYLLAEAWPAYSLRDALALVGVDGLVLVALLSVVPATAALVRPLPPKLPQLPPLPSAESLLLRLALGGVLVTGVLIAWTAFLVNQPNPDPLVRANRLALYWVEDRWRWPLMLAAGLAGLVGLWRLAARGRPMPLFWLAGSLVITLAGIAGLPVPIWWRFLLFAQVPLALGVATVLAHTDARTRAAVGVTLAGVAVFKVATLVGLPDTVTYFGSDLQPAYALGRVIPDAPGLVATDPFTAYYVPGASGHRVLSVTKAHVGSEPELAASAQGYRLLHAYYAGVNWWQAARRMWRFGVRYVVVEKSTSLAAPTLAEFSTGPTPLVRTAADRRRLGTYFYRNNRVGTLLYDSDSYVVYRLERSKLWS
jgi:hypothetical protein